MPSATTAVTELSPAEQLARRIQYVPKLRDYVDTVIKVKQPQTVHQVHNKTELAALKVGDVIYLAMYMNICGVVGEIQRDEATREVNVIIWHDQDNGSEAPLGHIDHTLSGYTHCYRISVELCQTVGVYVFNDYHLLGDTMRQVQKLEVITLALERVRGETFLTVKVLPAIEEFYRNQSASATERSKKWQDKAGRGFLFYTLSDEMRKKTLAIVNDNAVNDFGGALIRDGRVNAALLRVVGAGTPDGFTISTTDLMPYEEVKEYARQLGVYTRAFYAEFIADVRLRASVSFEVL